uniref:Uncharacterized protein n=1 Tax=Chromera velia CCMP2878 TaxID=1169474 RepID=A0A0G4G9H1_9ALVE|eukprot:Cvel_20888.t1-p1 / transcript=Cvel_20888.t1 / gene=Cvel_20888 / organism=Chromera_velia_CCMP2878 / gene_product=hypothetical protein / transcript_product=hypothetical protein / location=Cvel_scaffold1915:19307-20812(-) / protein_length=502 / sequence_SO=supercontig / SO=protein_coding / is_pseudo=false
MGLSTQTTATTCTAASTDTNTISRGTPPAFMEVGDDEEPPRRGRRRVPTPISRHRTDKGPGGQRGVTVQVDSPDRAHDLTADSHSANGGLTSSNVQTDFFTVTPPVQPPKGSAEGRGRARHRDRFGRGIETISHQKKERQNTLTASQLRKANKPNEEGGMLESLLNDQNLPVLAPDNSSSNQRQNSRFPPLRGQPTKTGSKLAGHTGNEAKDLGEKKKDKPSMKVTPGPAHHFQKHQERRLRQGISLPPNRHPNSRLPSQLPSLEDLKARAIARAALSKGRGRGGRHRESGSVHDGTLTHEPQSMAAPSHPPHTPTGFTRFPTRLHTQNTHSSSAVSPPTPVLSSEMETGKGGRIGKGEEKERERGRNDLTDLLSPIPSSSNFSPIPPGPKQEKERERTTTNSAAHSADPHYLALQKEKGNCGELKREHEPKEKTSVKTVRFVDVSIAKEGANVAGRGKEEEIRAKKGIKKEEAGPGKVTFSATSVSQSAGGLDALESVIEP